MTKEILLAVLIFTLGSCAYKQQEVDPNDYKEKRKIAMQRVKDTSPLAKQDLVSREAMQYAMLDKMNFREDRQRREFSRIQEKQREDFIQTQEANTKALEDIRNNIIASNTELVELNKITEQKATSVFNEATDLLAYTTEQANRTEGTFKMLESKIDEQSTYLEKMKDKYEEDLAFKRAQIAMEKERENTIRGVVENMYADQDVAYREMFIAQKEGMLPPSEWVELPEAPLTVHVADEKFESLMLRALNNASIHSGPWNLKWKLKAENEYLLTTKFSLDVETTFGQFINNVQSYIVNYNGVVLHFSLFKEKRLLVVSDS